MPTNKAPFRFHMDYENLEKMRYIAGQETRSLSNLLEYVSKQYIAQYEEKHGEIVLPE